MPGGWRSRQRMRQGARAALNRPWLKDPGAEDHTPVPVEPMPDPFTVDYPPLDKARHPTWWHVYRIETPRDVLIAECPKEELGHLVMARERWRTRMTKWKRETFESCRPLKP